MPQTANNRRRIVGFRGLLRTQSLHPVLAAPHGKQARTRICVRAPPVDRGLSIAQPRDALEENQREIAHLALRASTHRRPRAFNCTAWRRSGGVSKRCCTFGFEGAGIPGSFREGRHAPMIVGTLALSKSFPTMDA